MQWVKHACVLTILSYVFLSFITWDILFPISLGHLPATTRFGGGVLTILAIFFGTLLWSGTKEGTR